MLLFKHYFYNASFSETGGGGFVLPPVTERGRAGRQRELRVAGLLPPLVLVPPVAGPSAALRPNKVISLHTAAGCASVGTAGGAWRP